MMFFSEKRPLSRFCEIHHKAPFPHYTPHARMVSATMGLLQMPSSSFCNSSVPHCTPMAAAAFLLRRVGPACSTVVPAIRRRNSAVGILKRARQSTGKSSSPKVSSGQHELQIEHPKRVPPKAFCCAHVNAPRHSLAIHARQARTISVPSSDMA